jgi:hypothetical protein
VFLDDLISRPVTDRGGWRGAGLFVGQGQLALEVVAYRVQAKPNAGDMQAAWKDRRGNRGAPVLVVVLHSGSATIAGPSGEDLPILSGIDEGTAERLCRAALEQPDRHAALLFLAQAMPSLETAAPGLRNEGLFALHELTNDVPRRPEWTEHVERSRTILEARPAGTDLLGRLGFTVERLDNMTQLLKGADRRLALAVLLDRTDAPEAGSPRFGNLSPVSYALSKADQESLDWVVVVQGDRLRLYPTSSDKGVGRRGRAETYIEVQTSVLPQERLGYLTLLFSADALQQDGSVNRLLEDSKRFAASLADRLRDRIYNDVVPMLAKAVVQARNLTDPTTEQLDLTYRMALTILFRLLFVAYAEDRDLLPYRLSEAYRRRSLKQKAQELAEHARALKPPTPGTSHWDEVVRIWTAIERGDQEISVPPYNGGLFTRDEAVSKAGAALAKIRLPNELFEPALQKLMLSDIGDDGFQPVDFRSLGVREFGTIYEGLLESELSVADQDLMVDARGSYVPVRGAAVPVVTREEVYLHDRSGARKASGSYFTKHFAVEHLLDRALVPALEEHLARVAQLDEASAAEAFFDFRVADIAMGSGHFLVAAIDRIEKSFTDYLAQETARGAAGVRNDLARLREQAKAQLQDMAEQMAFEDSQLLRRLIARRCIYGVDQNPLSVQLARLAIWIHTFVPGLPLSVLDHNLVQGNSLVGIGTVREIEQVFEDAGIGMFQVDAHTLLDSAAKPLKRLANIADATLADVEKAREAMAEAKLAVADTKALCDIITAQRLDPSIEFQFEQWERLRPTIQRSEVRAKALGALKDLEVFHFPIAFPEVFLRKRSGFDVLLGNPPWEKIFVDEHEFWGRHFPGLRALPQRQQEAEMARMRQGRPDLATALEREATTASRMRAAVSSNPTFIGITSSHPDLYKAFMWRFWELAAAVGGRIGIVLPRTAFSAKGSEEFRKKVFTESTSVDLVMTLNRNGWVFDDAEHRYTIGLAALAKGQPQGETITLRGPYADLRSFDEGRNAAAESFAPDNILSWNDSASLPLLPTEASIKVFARLRSSPRLDMDDPNSWRFRPEQELNATFQKPLMNFTSDPDDSEWPVFKGESFDIWENDRGAGTYYAWAEPTVANSWLQQRRLRSRDGAQSEIPLQLRRDERTLPTYRARLAFRDITNRTNQRTVISALVPPQVFLTNKAPHLLRVRGDERDEAFLLGVLASRTLDWYARRFVELSLNFFIFNPFPVPRPSRDNPLWHRAVTLAGRLAAPDERFAEWAEAVGVECGPIDAIQKQDMIDELDAVVARLYGLDADQLTHIFETFHEGWDYQPRLDVVLEHFHRLAEMPVDV